MSVSYKAVGWNAFKKRYDLILVAVIVAFLAIFVGVTLAVHPAATLEIVLIRAFGTAGFFLLHFILIIGPMARLYPCWLPLLYNRRHLGVTMFTLALAHGAFSLFQFHALGERPYPGELRHGSLDQEPGQHRLF